MRPLIPALITALLAVSVSGGDSLQLEAMTFNLRYASEQSPNAWSARRPVVAAVIAESAPDVMGTQEGVWQQIKDIDEDCPDYDWVGLGRQGGSRGEFCAIFYRHAKFELVAFDHFWLSDTPEVIGSITWGHQHRRMATWVKLRDRETRAEFIVLNTHFDHRVEKARVNSATLIRNRIAQFDSKLPIIVLGDFNCLAGESEAFHILTTGTGLVDTWNQTKSRGNTPAPNTFHGYAGIKREGSRIDWILASESATVKSTEIITTHSNGQYPSDHFPVTATVEFSQ